ncbi:hypothetical protein ACSSS7_002936 [Eimeria intestinalis]
MADEDALEARGVGSLADLEKQESSEVLDEESYDHDGRASLVEDSSWLRGVRRKKKQRPSLPVGRAVLLLLAALCTGFAVHRIAGKPHRTVTPPEKPSLPAEVGGAPSLFSPSSLEGLGSANGEVGGFGVPANDGSSSSAFEDSSSSASTGPRLSSSSTSSNEVVAGSEAQNKEGAVAIGPEGVKAAVLGQADSQNTGGGSAFPSGQERPRASVGAAGLLFDPRIEAVPQTFLGSIAPSFSDSPMSTSDLKKLVGEKDGAEAASGLEALMQKQLPAEADVPFSTEALSTTMLEIRKQRLLSMAYKCFALRSEREQRYLTWRLMDQTLSLLEENCRDDQQKPARLAELLASYKEPVDLRKERLVVMRMKAVYEESLVTERVALDQLYYFLNELAGHLAAVELFFTMDTSATEWKEKVPKFKDAGSALYELQNLVGSDLLSSGTGMLSLAASTAKARKQLFASDIAAYKGVVRLADIVKKRRDINRLLRLAVDPKAGNMDERTSATMQTKAYELSDQLENMQTDVRNFLGKREGQPLVLESWLATIL